MTFLRLACFSLDLNLAFMAFILASAALCSLLPFLYLPIFALSLAMAASSFESFFFSFLASFLAAFLPFLPAFLPAFLAAFTLAAIFFLRAAIFLSAALCSLLPFLYLPILAFRACIAFSSFESFFFSFLVFFWALCCFSLAFLPPFLTTFLTTFFLLTFLRLACFSLDLNLAFMAFILASAALCSLLP